MNTKTIKNNKDDINIIGIFCIVDDVLKKSWSKGRCKGKGF
jgi:hypothetical protein